MQLVVFTRPGRFVEGDRALSVLPPRAQERAALDEVYAVPDQFCAHHPGLVKPVQVPEHLLPKSLTPQTLDKLAFCKEREVRILIVNGFGLGYGDMLVGSLALERLHTRIRERGKEPHIDFLIREGRRQAYREIFELNPHVDEIFSAVLPLRSLMSYDLLSSNEHLLFDPHFSTLNYHDFFLARVGLDPEGEPKEFSLYPDPRVSAEMSELARRIRARHPGERFCVLNFFASKLRSVPSFMWREFVAALSDSFKLVLVGAGGDEARVQPFVSGLPAELREKVVDLSAITARGFDHLTGILAHLADAVLTPDTSVLHASGMLEIPTLGIFFSIEPELRTRYYRTVEAYCPDFFRRSSFWGESRLPDSRNLGLEQDPEFVALWKRVEVRDLRRQLERRISAERETIRSPSVSAESC